MSEGLVFNMVGGGGGIKLQSIAVTTPPAKTSYLSGERFDPAGMVVEATYTNGTTANVTGYTCSPTALNTVGTQAITVSYMERGVTKTDTLTVTVERKSISAVPSQSGSLTYSGSALTPSWSNYDPDQLTISGEISATTAGTYYATFTPTANYRWSDGTITGKQVGWTIGKAAGSLSLSKTSITLNADAKSTTFTVTRAGDGAISAVSSDTSVATVSVSGTTVTVNSVNDKTGTATITVSVAAGTNHTAPSNKTCAVSCEFLPAIDTALNDISWADIKRISDAGLASSYFAVGDRKAVTLNGTVGDLTLNGTYYCNIIGIDHNPDIEGANRIHFQFGFDALNGGNQIAFVDSAYNTDQTSGTYFNMNNINDAIGGWNSSGMKNTIIPAFKACLPSDLQSVLKTVTKYSDNISDNNFDSSDVTATVEDIFLLSEFEVNGTTNYSNPAEANYQVQYAYYSAGNPKTRYAHSDISSSVNWWLRSSYSAYQFAAVSPWGIMAFSPLSSQGFAPAFCV